MSVTTTSTEELAKTIREWFPTFLVVRNAFLTTREEWGDYVYKIEVLAGDYFKAGDEFKPEHDIEWAKLKDGLSKVELDALLERLDEIQDKIKAAKAEVDKKMVALRKDYVDSLLPLYKECTEAFAHVEPCLTDLIKLVDVYGNVHRADRPMWWDSILEHALRLEKDGKLEEEWTKPFYQEHN